MKPISDALYGLALMNLFRTRRVKASDPPRVISLYHSRILARVAFMAISLPHSIRVGSSLRRERECEGSKSSRRHHFFAIPLLDRTDSDGGSWQRDAERQSKDSCASNVDDACILIS